MNTALVSCFILIGSMVHPLPPDMNPYQPASPYNFYGSISSAPSSSRYVSDKQQNTHLTRLMRPYRELCNLIKKLERIEKSIQQWQKKNYLKPNELNHREKKLRDLKIQRDKLVVEINRTRQHILGLHRRLKQRGVQPGAIRQFIKKHRLGNCSKEFL